MQKIKHCPVQKGFSWHTVYTQPDVSSSNESLRHYFFQSLFISEINICQYPGLAFTPGFLVCFNCGLQWHSKLFNPYCNFTKCKDFQLFAINSSDKKHLNSSTQLMLQMVPPNLSQNATFKWLLQSRNYSNPWIESLIRHTFYNQVLNLWPNNSYL